MASLSWAYAADQLIALRQQNQRAEAVQPVASGVDLEALNFRYAVEGDTPPWRPSRAYDDAQSSSVVSIDATTRCRLLANAKQVRISGVNRNCSAREETPKKGGARRRPPRMRDQCREWHRVQLMAGSLMGSKWLRRRRPSPAIVLASV